MMPAVISQSAARSLFPDRDALGRHFSRGIPGEDGFEVVGIVADIRLTSLDRTPPLMVYLPYWWRTRVSTSLVIKANGDPAALMPRVRRTLAAIDPEIAIGDARPLARFVDASVAGRRYQMRLFTVFGAVALFIAALGVYGVTSYGISRRRREMNIRVALGAEARQIRRMIVGQTSGPILAGIGGGIVGALALGGTMAALLFEVQPRDPTIIGVVTAVVGGVGLLATLLAVRRGLALDPAAALRED
jgi:ABC-type antimicrobial peptide transport system permease subunit